MEPSNLHLYRDQGATTPSPDLGQERPYPLPLRLPTLELPANQPSLLARLFRLDTYKDGRFLSYRAKQDLDLIARIFLVLFVFEWSTWTFLFNAIFTGDILGFKPLATGGAILIALIFATGVLWFERQILTADLQRLSARQRLLARGARLLFILASVLAVAQPVELLLFRLPIQDRVHAEGIRQEAASRLLMLSDLEGVANTIMEESPETELKKLRNRLSAARAKRDGSAKSLEERKRDAEAAAGREEQTRLKLDDAQQLLAEARADAAGVPVANQRVASALASHQEAARELEPKRQAEIEATQEAASAEGLVRDLEAREKTLQSDLEAFNSRHQLVLGAAERCQNRLRSWIAQLQGSQATQDAARGVVTTEKWLGIDDASSEEKDLWPGEWLKPFTYSAPSYNFFEQVSVVWDLAFSQPPVWPLGSAETKRRLEQGFGLGDQGGGRKSHFFRAAFFGVHMLAAFFPFLIFTIKWFVMPKDLEDYYSTFHQAAAGNPEAIRSLLVDKKAQEQLVKAQGRLQ